MEEAKNTFISSTNWTERMGPACSLAFIEKHERLKLGKILKKNGEKIRKIWKKAADMAELKVNFSGILPLSSFKIETEKKKDEWPAIITFFIQEMLKENILASDRCYSNYCQTEKELYKYEKACIKIFKKISYLSKKNKVEENLKGPIKQMGFKRLT